MYFQFTNHGQRTALITTDRVFTYADLQHELEQYCFHSEQKELILLLCNNEVELVFAYLAALQANHAVMLLHAAIHEALLEQIVSSYQPKWIVSLAHDSIKGYERQGQVLERQQEITTNIHQDLAVLLSTSGTTGSQKFVRLTYENMQSNAESIAQYLEIDYDERGILNLPLSYSYGLSILNSHLHSGAAVLLTDESIVSKEFWSFVAEREATSLPGVPFTYQTLQRIGFLEMDMPHLKTLTQAGGRLDERLVQRFASYAIQHNKRLYIMYGQTEAAPRMSYVPYDQVLQKSRSIGVAIPGGSFELEAESNQLIYRGANVMMGYAESLADLAKGDECNGVLYTGDTAEMDEDGFYTITGRMKRFIKLFGLRINLDEVERRVEAIVQKSVACIGNDDRLIIVVEAQEVVDEVKRCIEESYKLHRTAYKVVPLAAIPRMNNGKTDYKALKDELL